MHPNPSCACYSASKICYNTPTQGHEPAKKKSRIVFKSEPFALSVCFQTKHKLQASQPSDLSVVV